MDSDSKMKIKLKSIYNCIMMIIGLKTKWKRINFDSPKNREESEKETNQDIQKPIQQLICDVHEEANNKNREFLDNLMHENKRMTSMLGRVYLSNERSSTIMLILTLILLLFTIVQYKSSLDTNKFKIELEKISNEMTKANETLLTVKSNIEKIEISHENCEKNIIQMNDSLQIILKNFYKEKSIKNH